MRFFYKFFSLSDSRAESLGKLKFCNCLGKVCLVRRNGEHNIYLIAGDLVDLGEKCAESLKISTAYLKDRIDVDILDIKVARNQSRYKTEESLKGIYAVMISINQSYRVTYVISELCTLVYAYNIALSVLGGFVDHIDQYLGFAGTFFSYDDLYHK